MKVVVLSKLFNIFEKNWFDLPSPQGYDEYKDSYDLFSNKEVLFSPSHLMEKCSLYPPAHRMYPISTANSILRMQEEFAERNEEYIIHRDNFMKLHRSRMITIIVEELFSKHWKNMMTAFDQYRNTLMNNLQVYSDSSLALTFHKVFEFFNGKQSVFQLSENLLDSVYESDDRIETERMEKIGDILTKLSASLRKHSLSIKNKVVTFNDGKFNKKELLSKSIFENRYPRDFQPSLDYIVAWINHLMKEKQQFEAQSEGTLRPDLNGFSTFLKINPTSFIGSFFGQRTLDFLSIDFNVIPNLPDNIQNKLFYLNNLVNKLESSPLMAAHSENMISFLKTMSSAKNRSTYYEFYKKACVYGIEYRELRSKLLVAKLSRFTEHAEKVISLFEALGMNSSQFSSILEAAKKEFTENIITSNSKIDIFKSILKTLEVESELDNEKRQNEIDYKKRLLDFYNTRVNNAFEKLKRKLASELIGIGKELNSWLRSIKAKGVLTFQERTVNRFDSFEAFAEFTIPQLEKYLTIIPAVIKPQPVPVQAKVPEDIVIAPVAEEKEENIVIQPVEEERIIIKKFRIDDLINEPKECYLPSSIETVTDRRPENRRNIVKLATFNAEWLFPFADDKEQYIWETKKASRDHLKEVAKVIAQLDADIILVQEVQDCRALAAVVKLMEREGIEGYEPFLVENRDITYGQHVGIITRITPTQLDYIDLYSNVSVAKNIFARFTVYNEAGVQSNLALIGLHLISSDMIEKRNKQAGLISEFVSKTVPPKSEEKLIIMGDLNDYDACLEKIGPSPYSDALATLASSKNKMKNVLAGKPAHSRTQINGGIIDHILIDQKLAFQRATIRDDLVWTDESIVSDHAPVTVEIKL